MSREHMQDIIDELKTPPKDWSETEALKAYKKGQLVGLQKMAKFLDYEDYFNWTLDEETS